MSDMQAALRRLIVFYETLTPGAVSGILDVYAADAVFKDPFNEIRGHAAIIKVFEHMFVRCANRALSSSSIWGGATRRS